MSGHGSRAISDAERRARLAQPSVEATQDALYGARSLVRILGMRRTMFVVPVEELAAVVLASSTRALVPGERRRFAALLQSAGIAVDGERWMRSTEDEVERALRARGEATAGIVRGRPLGSWTSTLYRWAPTDAWLGEGFETLETDAAAATLVPALDPTAMGWKARDWYLGAHCEALFDRSGNIGPTIWWEGRIVGGWAQRKDSGEIVLRLLQDAGAEAAGAAAAEAQRLREWLGEVRVTPRFRTPLERELCVIDEAP